MGNGIQNRQPFQGKNNNPEGFENKIFESNQMIGLILHPEKISDIVQ